MFQPTKDFGIVWYGVQHQTKEAPKLGMQRLPCVERLALDNPKDSGPFPQDKSIKHFVLVPKILIQGSNAHPGDLGDAVRGRSGVFMAHENPSSRFQDRVNGCL